MDHCSFLCVCGLELSALVLTLTARLRDATSFACVTRSAQLRACLVLEELTTLPVRTDHHTTFVCRLFCTVARQRFCAALQAETA
jgi:hypothetical protein